MGMMKSVKTFLIRIVRLSMKDNVTRFQRRNVGLSINVNVIQFTRRNATPAMDKSVTPSTRRSARRLVMRQNAMKFQVRNVVMFPRRSVARFPRKTAMRFLSKFVRLLRRRNALTFLQPTARTNTPEYVVQSASHTALMFLTSTVTQFPMLNVTTPTPSIVSRFQSKSARGSQESIVSWFLASEPRRF